MLMALSACWQGNAQCSTIVLSSQADVDNYMANYGSCDFIFELNISGTDITNLNGLGNLPVIHNLLINCENLVSLQGLESLHMVENMLFISNCNTLTSLEGLDNLEYAEEFILYQDTGLTSLAGLNNFDQARDFTIRGCNSLTSLSDLGDFSTVGLTLSLNNNLSSLEGVMNLTLRGIHIENNPALISLEGLEFLESIWSVTLTDNANLSSLKGLENLQTANTLTINNSSSLTTLEELENLRSLNGLYVHGNTLLTTCSIKYICDILDTLGDLSVQNNGGGDCDSASITAACAIADCTINTTWNGSAWSNGRPVNFSYNATISGDFDSALQGNIIACSLTVQSGNVLMASGYDMFLKGSLTINPAATLTFEDNANLVQADDAAVNTGIIDFKKNSSPLYNYDYTLWSSPVTGLQTLKQFSPLTLDERFYVYNTDLNAFSNYTSQSGIFGGLPEEVTFTMAKGYLIRMPDGWSDTVATPYQGTFSGTPNTGDISLTLATGGNGYNAVGNPYPSPISVYDFIDANEDVLHNGTLYFWRKRNSAETATSSYCTITKADYVGNIAGGGDTGAGFFANGNEANWVINPGQGFFVKAAPAGGNLSFDNTMRRTRNNGQFFRIGPGGAEIAPISRLKLNINGNEGSFSQAAVAYTADATLDLDYGWDGRLYNDGELTIYSLAGETRLAIQARPEFWMQDVVPLGYKATHAGELTIALENLTGLLAPLSVDVLLRDKALGTSHSLRTSGYTFATEAGTFNERFEIFYAEPAMGSPIPALPENNCIVYRKDGAIHISGPQIAAVEVFDALGKLLYTQAGINASEAIITRLAAQQQLLLVRITTTEGAAITKKIVF